MAVEALKKETSVSDTESNTGADVKQMGGNHNEFDVVIAGYTDQDGATQDFQRLVQLVEAKEVQVEGLVLATKDTAGEVTLNETGNHLGRSRLKIGGGMGLLLVLGLLWPPLLIWAAIVRAVGDRTAAFVERRVENGLKEKLGAKLPSGGASIIAIYDRGKADTVNESLANRVTRSVVPVDLHSVKQLTAAFAKARAQDGESGVSPRSTGRVEGARRTRRPHPA